ncbi:diguanylate cyclase [Candidatus Riflebacteria bacterium]
MNLWSKLILAFIIVSIFPLTYLGFKSVNSFENLIGSRIANYNLTLAKLVAKETYNTLTMARQTIHSLSKVSKINDISDLSPEKSLKMLSAFSREFSIFKNLYIVGPRQSGAGFQLFACTNPQNFQLGPGWGWSQVVANQYKGNLSKITFNEKSKKPTIRLEMFIRSKDNHPVAVLGGELDLSYVAENLKRLGLKNETQAYAVTKDGKVIASTQASERFPAWSESIVLKEIRPDILKDWGLTNEKYAYSVTNSGNIIGTRDGVDYVSIATPLRQFDLYQAPQWFIIIEQPRVRAFKEAFSLILTVNKTTVMTIFLAIFFGFLFGKTLTRPIKMLVLHAKQISSGDLDQEIADLGRDEIGELARNFETMRLSLFSSQKQLADKVNQLSTLNEVGKAICSVLDFHELMDIVLKITMQLMHADRGSLMLLDEDETQLSIQASQGVWDKSVKKFTGKIGDPIAGWVLKRDVPLIIKDTKKDPLFLELRKGKPIGGGTMMCVPLRVKDKVLGVLNVRHKQENFFTEENFDLFKHLAQNAAIAIENARLYRYAVTDEMTKLYNHRFFQMRLDEEMQRADRFASSCSLLISDIDNFKRFNDTYGHQEGDRVLKVVAKIMLEMVRDIDVVCRYGGEEFCVICPNKAGRDAHLPAERIRKAVAENEFYIAGEKVQITISIGIGSYPSMAQNKKELIKKADTALYSSKHNGRNRSTIWEESLGEVSEK